MFTQDECFTHKRSKSVGNNIKMLQQKLDQWKCEDFNSNEESVNPSPANRNTAFYRAQYYAVLYYHRNAKLLMLQHGRKSHQLDVFVPQTL